MRHLLAITAALTFAASGFATDPAPVNFVLIFCDDLGYGDLGCYGSTQNRTPNIHQLANEGMKFTDFYSSSPVCTPSRASLMTGCYPHRAGMHDDQTGHWVLISRSRRGRNPAETTIAEILQSRGYATACIGKWHLGDQPEHLPTQHGFDYYFGIPYSNDMQSAQRGDPQWRLEIPFAAPADAPELEVSGPIGPKRPGKLVNLSSDLQEKTDVAAAHPEVVRRLNELAKRAITALGNDQQQGGEPRPAKTLDSSRPMTLDK